MDPSVRQEFTDRVQTLRGSFGELMTPKDLAKILHYPSEQAVIKAHERGSLPVPLVKIEGRRGWYVTVIAVAECLSSIDRKISYAKSK